MKLREITLLITSAAQPSAPYTALSDTKMRVVYTLDSIRVWRDAFPELKIVLCDGSGYDFNSDIERVIHSKLTNFEVLSFRNSVEMVSRRGKGYGEGEIVNFALKNSSFLRNSSHFAKCTGKLWVENFSECLAQYNGALSIEKFYRGRYSFQYTECDTRFYIVDKELYERTFASCGELVNDPEGYYLETAFSDAIKGNKISYSDFKCKPLIFGFSGTSGLKCHPGGESWRRRIFRNFRRLVV